jgi:hypothetical protein
MARREYKGAAIQTTLVSGINNSGLSLSLTDYTGWPTGSFTMIIDPGLSSEEKLLCTSRSTAAVVITSRGYDNTAASSHSAGAVCYPAPMAVDFDEANAHIAETTTAHGLTLANLVKTTDTGTVTSTMILDGTILNADVNASAAIAYSKLNLAGGIVTGDIANNTIVDADINASAAITATKIAGTAVTQADTGTVTSAMIANGTIVDADINSAAAITFTKLATPTADFAMGSHKITGVTDPTSNQDAATKAYADLMIPLAQRAAANGVATLDSSGLIPTSQLPPLAITDTFVVATQVAMLALDAQVGDVAVRTDQNKSYILKTAGASTLANWQELLTPTDSVLSVDGLTGAVSLSSTYATVANAANKLPLAGGTMSGAIAMGTNKITGLGTPTATTDAATKAYADSIVATAPSNLTGPITSTGAATAIASQTGTGTKFVVDTSPTLVTPNIGVATATSVNGTTIPTSKTLVDTTNTLAVMAATTSAQLAGVISDETGSGSLVFATSPTLVTPNLGTPSAISLTNATNTPTDATKANLASPTFTGTVTIPTGAVITSPKINSTYTAKTAAYTFASGDEGQLFSMNNAATQQFNIPVDATFNFAIGTEINVFWITGAGQPTIGATTPGTTTVISTGATSATPKLRVANSGATCKKLAANSWIVFGDLA